MNLTIYDADHVIFHGGELKATLHGQQVCSARFKRIATDGDGTLYESYDAIVKAFQHGLAHLRGNMPVPERQWREDYAPLIPQGWAWGMTWAEMLRILGPDHTHMTEASDEEIASYMADLGARLVESGESIVTSIEPVANVLRFEHEHGILIEEVTGTPEAMAKAMIRRVKLEQVVSHVRGPESYREGKPHGEPYQPYENGNQVLALEDSPNGIISAVKAEVETIIGCLGTDRRRHEFMEFRNSSHVVERPVTLILINSWEALRTHELITA